MEATFKPKPPKLPRSMCFERRRWVSYVQVDRRYFICRVEDGKPIFEEMRGAKPVDLNGAFEHLDLFLHPRDDEQHGETWAVSEGITGCRIASGRAPEIAQERAFRGLMRPSSGETQRRIDNEASLPGRLSPRYARTEREE